MDNCVQPVEIAWYMYLVLLFALSMMAWGVLSFAQWLARWNIHTNNLGIQFHKGACYEAPCIKAMEA